MGRDQNDDKKRALVMGKFKFLYQDDTEDLESGDKFQLAIVQNKLLGPVVYKDRSGKDPDVLKIYGKEREDPGRGFSDPDIKIPGALKTFSVVWTNPFGDIFIDSDIKLFEFEDIQKYSGYNDGPESAEFCRFYTSSSSKELDGFDSSIFWSAGFLWKHFKTCGVEQWDKQFTDLVTHYRNWREWSHKVHHLPSIDRKETKRDTDTQRRERRESGNNNSSTVQSSVHCSTQVPVQSVPALYSIPPPPTLTAPPPGHPIYLPLAGPDGKTVQVQIVTVPPTNQSASLPPAPGSRFKYINPHHAPPPSSWVTQVDDFLSLAPKSPPSTRCSTPKKRTNSGSPHSSPERKREQGNRTKEKKEPKKASKFRPKAAIVPPSPQDREVDKLDLNSTSKIYVGKIIDWRGKFGFMISEDLEGKIFIHSKDILDGREKVSLGCGARFQVLHQDSSVVGAKAVNVKIQK